MHCSVQSLGFVYTHVINLTRLPACWLFSPRVLFCHVAPGRALDTSHAHLYVCPAAHAAVTMSQRAHFILDGTTGKMVADSYSADYPSGLLQKLGSKCHLKNADIAALALH